MSGHGVKTMALETVILRCQHVKFDLTQLISKGKGEVLKTAGCVLSQCSSSWLHVLVLEIEYSADLESMVADNSCYQELQ